MNILSKLFEKEKGLTLSRDEVLILVRGMSGFYNQMPFHIPNSLKDKLFKYIYGEDNAKLFYKENEKL